MRPMNPVTFRTIMPVGCLILALGACARANITPTAQNQAIVTVSAAPACGEDGAMSVASRMAAVATIRQGYDRYLIGNAQSGSNVTTTFVQGTSYTSGSVRSYGNTAYGSFTTTPTYIPVMSGRNKADLYVMMYRVGDPGSDNAIDARLMLGKDWEKLVKDGINTCT